MALLRTSHLIVIVRRDSIVGVATRYELDGQGIESREGEGFRTRSDRTWGPPSPLYNGYRVIAWGKTRSRGLKYPPPFAPRLKN
jgi:hypothetical protein